MPFEGVRPVSYLCNWVEIFLVRWQGFITHACVKGFGVVFFFIFISVFIFVFVLNQKSTAKACEGTILERKDYHSGCNKNSEPH